MPRSNLMIRVDNTPSVILRKARSEITSDRKITFIIGKPMEKTMDIENVSRQKKYNYYSFDYIPFENDLNLCLDIGVVAYGNKSNFISESDLITEFDIRCYFRIPKQQSEWPDIFSNHNNYFTDEANVYTEYELSKLPSMPDSDYIEIGLYRQITLEEELKACLEEYKACLDGRSSRTALEIKRRFVDFLCFHDDYYDYADEDSNSEFHLKSIHNELESILNEFLICIKNHKSC